MVGNIVTEERDSNGLLEYVDPLIIFYIFPGFYFSLEGSSSTILWYLCELWKQELCFTHDLLGPFVDVYPVADEMLIQILDTT